MATITGNEIINTVFGYIPSATGHNNKGQMQYHDINLIQAFMLAESNTYKEKILKVGDNYPIKEMYPNEYQYSMQKQKYNNMKSDIPRFYIGATFKDYGNNFPCSTEYVSTITNLMTIDVDAKDNTHVELSSLRQNLLQIPYVFGVFMSISRKGLYVVIPIKDGKYTTDYYQSIVELWQHNYGINCDERASNLTRARILSYNHDWKDWCKWRTTDNIQIFTKRKLKEEVNVESNAPILTDMSFDRTHKAIHYMIDNGYYVKNRSAWYYLGCECANFDDGEQLFYTASYNGNNTGDYSDSDKEIDKMWKQCTPSGVNEQLAKKWQGMCKNMYGKDWWK